MKKLSVFLFVCLLLVPCSAARSIGFRTGNDCWNNALAYNNDDLKSYSFGFNYETDTYGIRTEAFGFTGRLLNDRFDLLETTFAYNLNLQRPWKLTLTAGFDLYGFIHLDFFQNKLHETFNIETVNLPYGKTDVSFLPLLRADVEYQILPWLSAYSDFNVRFGLDSRERAGLKASFDLLTFNLGYLFNQTFITEPVLEKYVEETAGLNYGFRLDKGQLLMEFSANPLTFNGFTTVTISPLSPLEDSILELSIIKAWMSLFPYSIYSNELAYKNFLLVSRGHTGAPYPERQDDFIWGAGYRYFWNQFTLRGLVQYMHHWHRIPLEESRTYSDSHSNDIGLALEASYGIKLGKYTITLLAGGNWFVKKGLGYLYGLGLTL